MSHFSADVVAPSTEAPTRRPASAARLAANRANAQRSTGPKTEEGKARSRANALKHGLAGEGICLPSEDAALVRERCLQLHEEMAPQTVGGMMLVEALAIAHTRMKRAVRQEVAVLSSKQRHAEAAFDDERLTQVEEDIKNLSIGTATRYRHLIATPEGVDRIIARLGDVRAEVRRTDIRWNYIHGVCLENLCGREYGDKCTESRMRALSLALEFEDTELTEQDKAEIAASYAGKIKEWAKPRMEAAIDAEIARLVAHRQTLDHEGIARDRAEAGERAMFDAGRDASLARRYEAAATRTFFRALKEFRVVERRSVEPDSAKSSALDEPSPGVAEALDEGDALAIADPADVAAQPPPPRRQFERLPLASSGITAEQASREISQPDASRPPVPFDQPMPPISGALTRSW